MAVQASALSTHSRLPGTLKKTERLRTVVVDDSPVFTELACFILAQHPAIEVIGTAQDGIEAIETALLLRPSLIVMDVNMPRLDGLSAVTTLLNRLPTTRIILMSSENTPLLRAECRRHGAAAFVPKMGFAEEIQAALQVLQLDRGMQEQPS